MENSLNQYSVEPVSFECMDEKRFRFNQIGPIIHLNRRFSKIFPIFFFFFCIVCVTHPQNQKKNNVERPTIQRLLYMRYTLRVKKKFFKKKIIKNFPIVVVQILFFLFYQHKKQQRQ